MDGDYLMVPAGEYSMMSWCGELVAALVEWLKRPENVQLREWLIEELKGE